MIATELFGERQITGGVIVVLAVVALLLYAALGRKR